MSKYPLESLREKIFVKHGFPFKSQFFSDSGEYIVLTPGNFLEEGGFKRQVGKEKFYVGEVPEEYLHSKGDLIVAMTEQAAGLLGSCALVPENNVYLHNQRLGLITVNDELIDKDFIYYLFKTSNVRNQIRQSSSGSKVKHTSPERIYDVVAPLPVKEEQRKIAKILSVLDKKIELNSKINAELEAMAKLIYDYWFVQFDFPDANGKPYKSSGGKMVYDDALKREIPEGWEAKKIKDIASTGSGGTPLKSKSEYYENGSIPWINSGEVNEPFIIEAKKFITELGVKKSSAKPFSSGTILMAMYGATAGKVSFIDFSATTNQAICAINPYNKNLNYYLKFGLEDLYKYLVNLSSGSARDNLSQDKIKELTFSIPPDELLKKYDATVRCGMSKILTNMKENSKLVELRDWLLPMLMNGQVTIKS